jgi:hypothetical protein
MEGVRVIYNGIALTQYLTCDYDKEKNVFSDHAPIYYPDLDLIVWNVCFMGKLIGIKVKKDIEDENDIEEKTIQIPNNKFRGVILENDKDYHIRLKHISSVINNIDVSCWLIQEMFADDPVKKDFFKIDKRYDTEINKNRPAQSIIVKREDLTETILEKPHIQRLKTDIIIYDKIIPKAYGNGNVNKIGYMYRIIEKTKKIYFSIHVRYGTTAEEISKMFTDLLNIISKHTIFRDYIIIFGGDYNMDIIANNIKDKFLYISDTENKDNSYTTTIHTTHDNKAYAYADNNCKPNDTNIDFCVVYSPLLSEELSKQPLEQPLEQPHIINTPHHTILELPLYNKQNIVSKEKVNSFFANYEKINNRKYNKQTDYTNILYNDEFIGGLIEEKLEMKSPIKSQSNAQPIQQQSNAPPIQPQSNTPPQPTQSNTPQYEEKKEPDNINTILSSIFGVMVVIIVIVLLASQSKKSSKKNKHKI